MTTIELAGLTKRFGRTLAVDDVTATIRSGAVTGFLGPNGSGKSTTMRMILGLDGPTAGTARIGGRAYTQLRDPMRVVGALLDAGWVHQNRSARSHLRWVAAAAGLPKGRPEEVLDLVGLTAVARKPVRTFSLGMRQRLGLAGALLGDPEVLVLDEPVNGLDPAGIAWMRGLLQRLAAQGRTVLVSSHLLAEMAQTATELVVLGSGRVVAQGSTADVLGGSAGSVRVQAADPAALSAAVRAAGLTVRELPGEQAVEVPGVAPAAVGEIAAQHQLVLHELTARQPSLEEAFMELTGGTAQFVAKEVAS
ncbi:ATP-binding cassette domain-containing protein [Pseudonocardia sp. CA-107938]|uniref:ATP-binding cassette domain-containing protein n=1 Tax=Pseudonocardia sp. CA-107938 TaxID=3240021 RepID=UPI003D9279F1